MAGVRSGKTVTTTDASTGETTTTHYKYITLSGKLTRLEYNDREIDFIYDEDGRPYAMVYESSTKPKCVYYYILNVQGDVVALMNEAGNVVADYTYDEWGKLISVTGSNTTMGNITPLRYRGYIYDRDTGLYYLQSRYYDPAIGRFINADTYTTTDADGILSSNMFAYCENNPVNRSDPNGEWVHVLVGGLIGAATSYISARICGATPKEALESAAWGAASGALSAALPGAGALIDVGMNVAESVVSDCVDGKDAGTVVSNAFISATIGAVTGSRNSYITSSQTWKNIGKVTQSFSKIVKGNHPKIKALNKKFSKKVFKKASKSLALDFLSEISAGIVGKYAKF